MAKIILDDTNENADWIKTLSWDMSSDPMAFTQEELEHLSTLPAWKAAPPEIKAALGKPELTAESQQGQGESE
jgi:hypothetical protein